MFWPSIQRVVLIALDAFWFHKFAAHHTHLVGGNAVMTAKREANSKVVRMALRSA